MREQEQSTGSIQTQGPRPQKPFLCIQLALGPVGRLVISSVVVDTMKHFRLVRNNHLPPLLQAPPSFPRSSHSRVKAQPIQGSLVCWCPHNTSGWAVFNIPSLHSRGAGRGSGKPKGGRNDLSGRQRKASWRREHLRGPKV